MSSSLRASTSIVPKRASSHTLSKPNRPAMPTLPRSSRRSAIGSSVSCVGWDIWRREWRLPWLPGMIRCSTTNRSLPAPWWPRSSSALPLGSGLERKCAASARALAMKENALALTGHRCASVNGFSLHANTAITANRREKLERLLRYTARGAVSLERLQADANGDLLYTFTHPWSDGTTGIKLSPLELLEKLAALVPLPHVHLVRYGGCLAPHSHLRRSVIPTPRQQGLDEPEACPPSPRWSWARLLQRVFALEMARCPWCQQGMLRLIAVITQGEVIRKILHHLKLSVDPPPIA